MSQASPQPQSLPPITRTVAVYRALPAGLTQPCPEPQWSVGEIVTDVDLGGLLSRYRHAYACTAAKLQAINRLQRD